MSLFEEPALRSRGGSVEEEDEEEDGAGNMDEGIGAVSPSHQEGVGEEPFLDIDFDKNAEALLEMDDLQRMLTGCVDSRGLKGDSSKGTPQLVHLADLVSTKEKDGRAGIPSR